MLSFGSSNSILREQTIIQRLPSRTIRRGDDLRRHAALREPTRALHAEIADVYERQFQDLVEARPELPANHLARKMHCLGRILLKVLIFRAIEIAI